MGEHRIKVFKISHKCIMWPHLCIAHVNVVLRICLTARKMAAEIDAHSAFPQLMQISIKMAITLEGGVSIYCIYYTIFSKVLCLSFCQVPSPYQDSNKQIICGNPAFIFNNQNHITSLTMLDGYKSSELHVI